MADAIPEPVEALLLLMAALTTTTPTIREVDDAGEAAGIAQDDLLDRLGAAIDLGLVDPADDYGPETLFCLSTLAAERLEIEPTFDSRRWMSRESRELIGPHDPEGRYCHRRPDTSEDLSVPLHHRVDARQLRPDEIVIPVGPEPKRFNGEEPESAPQIHRFYGIGAIWEGEEEIAGACPYCGGAEIGVHAYCLKCHNAGMDRFMKKPGRSRRKNMPKGQSKLKGGV